LEDAPKADPRHVEERRTPAVKYSKIVVAEIRMLSKEQAEEYVGGAQVLADMEEGAWIKPAIQRHRLTRYDSKALDAACDRLSAGNYPID
jgi:hypothetical protein